MLAQLSQQLVGVGTQQPLSGTASDWVDREGKRHAQCSAWRLHSAYAMHRIRGKRPQDSSDCVDSQCQCHAQGYWAKDPKTVVVRAGVLTLRGTAAGVCGDLPQLLLPQSLAPESLSWRDLQESA